MKNMKNQKSKKNNSFKLLVKRYNNIVLGNQQYFQKLSSEK